MKYAHQHHAVACAILYKRIDCLKMELRIIEKYCPISPLLEAKIEIEYREILYVSICSAGGWGWPDSNQRRPKSSDLQSPYIQLTTTNPKTYQPKI